MSTSYTPCFRLRMSGESDAHYQAAKDRWSESMRRCGLVPSLPQ